MGAGKFDAAAFRAAAGIKTITATAVLINGETEEVPLRVLRGDDALAARKRVYQEAARLKELMPAVAEGGTVDVSAITEEQLVEAGRVQSDCYRDILARVVAFDGADDVSDDDWDAFANATGGRDSDFGVAVYRAAGLTHPRSAEGKREERGLYDNLPFSSRGRRA